ncbi:MAG: HAD family hydrolase [Actinomycetota bacterium]
MDDAGRPADPIEVLLLDFGGVCLLNPVELHARAEQRLDLPPGTLSWRGPLDPSTDPLWRSMVGGDLTEREYWAIRAGEVGELLGRRWDTGDYMRLLYDPPRPELVRAAATETVRAARAAGYGVSVLTNDLRAFHGPDWATGLPFFELIDHLVDCSDTNILKPDRRAFDRAADVIGTPLDRMLFVDDQPGNVAGAEAVGLPAMWFDIAKADAAWRQVADRLELGRS